MVVAQEDVRSSLLIICQDKPNGKEWIMRFIFASDSFKGSLSSEKANDTLERAARDVFGSIESKKIEIADGGEGTLEAIQASDI